MKNFLFEALRDFKAFQRWRENIASSAGNKYLLILFITHNGTQEEQAQLRRIKFQKVQTITRRCDADLDVLASACCSYAGVTLGPGAEGGVGAKAGAGRKKRGIDAEGGGPGPRQRKQPARNRPDVQPEARLLGNKRKRQRKVKAPAFERPHVTGIAASPRQPVLLTDGITCSSCDTPAKYTCDCTLTNFCVHCSSYSNYCDLCHASFEGCWNSQSKCSSCFYELGEKKDIISCKNCKKIIGFRRLNFSVN